MAGELQSLPMQFGGEVDQIVFAETLPVDGRRLGGEGLGWPGLLARNRGRWNRTLLDRPYRLACDAIKHIQESGLVRCDHRLDAFSIHCDVTQNWRRGCVVLPNIV